MKVFFLWLGVQLFFARMLLGMGIYTWKEIGLPAGEISTFIWCAAAVCIAETIASSIICFNIIDHDLNARRYGSR